MPDQKISQLTAGGAAQATDEFAVARSGGNNKVTGANVAAAATSVGTLSSLTVSGNLTVDTNTLFVDSVNNRVGIGTTVPNVAFEVRNGSIRTLSDGSDAVASSSGFYLGNAANNEAFMWQQSTVGSTLNLWTYSATNALNWVPRFSITAPGNVGIGTTSPAFRLDVQSTGNTLARVGGSGTGQAGFYVASGGAFAPFILFQSSGTTTEAGINAPPGTGSLVFTTGALSTSRWTINSSGHFLASTDASFDIGASGANRPRDIYMSRNLRVGGVLIVSGGATELTAGSWLTFGANNTLFSDTTNGTMLQAAPTADRIVMRNAAGTEITRIKSGGQVRFVPLAAAPTTNVEDGDVYYDSSTNKLRVRAGGAWVDLH